MASLVPSKRCRGRRQQVTDEEAKALEDVRGFAGARRVVLPKHARDEMYQAGAQVEDVLHALANADSIRASHSGRWKVTGKDLDGDDLDVVVLIEDGLIVVTVM
jgi:hypothetical protein